MPKVKKGSSDRAIKALDKAWGDAATKGDVASVVSLYAKDGSLVWPDAPAIHGIAKIKKAWTQLLKPPGVRLKFTPETITISADGQMAADFGIVESQAPKGSPTEIAKYLVVWQKVNGTWKVLYDSYNSNKPGAATPTQPGS